MLADYAKEHGFPSPVHFTDDGISGTRFDRPGFLSMMEEVSNGNVQTIIVKDMSRLGRDYLQVGECTEYLRKMNVRLIAINDNVDSFKGDDDLMPIRNIMNEWYAKDTSKKIKSVFKAKGMAGKHVASACPYGYLKDKEDGNHWIVDEEAAEIVRRIFRETIEGKGPYQIANGLTADGIEVPAKHMARHGQGLWQRRKIKNPYKWSSSTIASLLSKREYLGHTVNFKTQKHFKDKKSHYVSEDNWVIFENTQEPIIDEETFELAQKVRRNVRRYPDGWGEVHPLTGLMYCADCGAKMYVHRTSNGKRIPQYTCSAYGKVPVGTLCSTQHRIREENVLTMIRELLKAIADYSKLDREAFIQTVREAQEQQGSMEVTRSRTKLEANERRAKELETLLCRIYEDNILGRLPDERYRTLSSSYEAEKERILSETVELEAAIQKYNESTHAADRFIKLIDKYESFDDLTNPMLVEFIDKILVHERDRKGSTQTTQRVEIYFSFIGQYFPPGFIKEPTPEEIAEVERMNALRDKRHQQYLRRKESGWQARYEARYSRGRKKKIDQMKEAIRKEDIAKGIYIPVADTPVVTPKKGVLV